VNVSSKEKARTSHGLNSAIAKKHGDIFGVVRQTSDGARRSLLCGVVELGKARQNGL